MELAALVVRSGSMADCLHLAFEGSGFSDEARPVVALSMCEIAFEHASAVRLLMGEGHFTPAIALLRPQYEALVRAAWILHVASEAQVGRLTGALNSERQQAAKNLPSVKDMLEALVKSGPPGCGRLLTRFRDRLWDGLNSFVHAGLHPVARRHSGYPAELLADVLRNSNAVMALTGLVLTELSQDDQTAQRFSTVLAEFEDCVPAMEPFPDD
jgi:hypothetical protein